MFLTVVPIYQICVSCFARHSSLSLPLFDWRLLAIIQAIACLSISALVTVALLQNPELYGLRPDGEAPNPLPHNSHEAVSEAAAVQLNDMARGSSVDEGHPDGSSGAEQTSGMRRRSGEQADASSFDAGEADASDSGMNPPSALEGLTVRQALRRPIFWMIVLSIFFIDVLWGGFNLHFTSVLDDQGLGRTSGAGIFLATSIAAAASSLLCGPFFDRLPVGMKVRMRPIWATFGLLLLDDYSAASGHRRGHWLRCTHPGIMPLLHVSCTVLGVDT